MFDTYAEIFARRAASYHGAMARWPHVRDAEFAMVLAPLHLHPGARLVDVPAGGGYLARYLPKGVRYVAVEPSADFFHACPEAPGRARVLGHADATGLDTASVDAVVSLAGLHHAPDLDAVFRELRRILRTGGTLVAADVEEGSPTAAFLNGFVDRNNSMGHKGVFFDGATAARLATAGFDILSDTQEPVPWRFASAADCGGYCKALFGIDRADEADVASALLDGLGHDRETGGIAVRWSLRRIVATAR